MSAPYSYIEQNIAYSSYSPSTLHTRNNALFSYFFRYLFMELMSKFKFTIPEHWAMNYFRGILFGRGFISVVKTDKYGVICQDCGLMGYNVFYQPTNAVISNPLLTGILQPRIGKECAIIKIKDDYTGILDLLAYYADHMALITESAEMNIANSKVAFMFSAKNRAGAESMKKVLDQIMSGNVGVFYDEKLRRDRNGQSETPYDVFNQNVKNIYIAGDLIDLLRRYKEMFFNDVGINSVNTTKKERLITDEANANNEERMSKIQLMIENIRTGMNEANKIFGINLSVELTGEGVYNERNINTEGAINIQS